jgi:hypothetical protein
MLLPPDQHTQVWVLTQAVIERTVSLVLFHSIATRLTPVGYFETEHLAYDCVVEINIRPKYLDDVPKVRNIFLALGLRHLPRLMARQRAHEQASFEGQVS